MRRLLLSTTAVLGVAALSSLLASSPAQAETFVYDWSTANSSASGVPLDPDPPGGADTNDNWLNIGGSGDGSTDLVRSAEQPAFFTGNYYASTFGPNLGDDHYNRTNDGNFGYAIPSDASSVTISYLLTADSNLTTPRVGLKSVDGWHPINFGLFNPNQWGFRTWNQGIVMQPGTGAAELDSTTRTYRATLIIDMTPVGSVKLADLIVENLTDGGYETILQDEPFDLENYDDPSEWNGLFTRTNGWSTTTAAVDDITISVADCEDDIDNDGDGFTDFVGGDPGCKDASWSTESPQCQDGVNNNSAQEMNTGSPALIDYDGGESLDLDGDDHVDAEFNPAEPAVTAPDPECVGKGWKKLERRPYPCGLGAELALLLPPLMWLSRRRRRSFHSHHPHQPLNSWEDSPCVTRPD